MKSDITLTCTGESPNDFVESDLNSRLRSGSLVSYGSFATEFESIVATYRDHLAIETADIRLTYDQVNRLVNRRARQLVQWGVSQDAPVVIFLTQGIDALTCGFAVMKAGGFYLPIDPAFPKDANSRIIADSTARLVITSPEHYELAKQLCPDTCRIVRVEDLNSSLPESNLGLAISPKDYAYVIATSGSTGVPKGVVQCQSSLVFNARNQAQAFGIDSRDKVVLCYSPSVMGAVRPIYNTLMCGGALSLVNVKTEGFAALHHAMNSRKITVLHCVATVFRHFAGSLNGEAFPHLRMVILGGEATTNRDWELFKSKFPPNCEFSTGLGSTEAGTICVNVLDRDSEVEVGNLSPGRPLPGVTIDIVDGDRRRLPPGEVGEIAVSSPAVASGYWRRDDLTERSFVHLDPDSDTISYLSGDVGRLLPDGRLEITGRTDFQIKVRGLKVDLSRVETAILEYPSIDDVIVIGYRNRFGDAAVGAYCLSGEPLDSGKVRAFLEGKLPDYMIPSQLIRIDSFPQTPNGKLDRKRLIQQAEERCRADAASDEAAGGLSEPEGLPGESDPKRELHQAMSVIWRRVLKIGKIGVDDNFFNLGGNSLMAMELALELSRGLGREISVAMIFKAPTIARLAVLIEQGHTDTSLFVVRPTGSKSPLFFINSAQCFQVVQQHLKDTERPLIGVNIFGLTDRFSIPYSPTIEEIAALIVEEMISAQPTGSFHLATYCGDGYLTLEIAQQLRRQGRTVASLCLIDVLFGFYEPDLTSRLYAIFKAGPRRSIPILAGRGLGRVQRMRKARRSKPEASRMDTKGGRDRKFHSAYLAAKKAYDCGRYDGDGVSLLLSSEWKSADLGRVERVFNAGLHREEVVGFHQGWTDRVFVESLGAVIENCLMRDGDREEGPAVSIDQARSPKGSEIESYAER